MTARRETTRRHRRRISKTQLRHVFAHMAPHFSNECTPEWCHFHTQIGIYQFRRERTKQISVHEKKGEAMSDHTRADLVYKKQTEVKGFIVKQLY